MTTDPSVLIPPTFRSLVNVKSPTVSVATLKVPTVKAPPTSKLPVTSRPEKVGEIEFEGGPGWANAGAAELVRSAPRARAAIDFKKRMRGRDKINPYIIAHFAGRAQSL